LQDWQSAGLRAESYFRMYVLTMHQSELTVIGHLTERDWSQVKPRVRTAFAI
ncbi:MAG: transcriptional regulator, partial [Candidatus Solibacter sp.]|nr:transcriptional regulator [Candidatus Solibacter sp.]